jgi:predicted SAM-dependent methyltransferase
MKPLLKVIAWEYLNPAFLWLRRRAVYRWDATKTGINLGCGLHLLPDWVGIDGGVYVPLRHAPTALLRLIYPMLNTARSYEFAAYRQRLKAAQVIHHDLLYGIPFGAGVAPNIYSSHFLEHLTKPEATALLHECYRVLQNGGTLRIVVPSLDVEVGEMRAAIDRYDQGDRLPVMQYLTWQPGFTSPYAVHRHMYDFDDLAGLLASVGFVDIVEQTFGSGRMPDVAELDNRAKSLFVEASKRQ